jgi:hypothetical protein
MSNCISTRARLLGVGIGGLPFWTFMWLIELDVDFEAA